MNLAAAPLHFTYPCAILFWAVFAWCFAAELLLIARNRPQSAIVAPSSLRVLTIGLALAFACAFSLAGKPAWRWSPAMTHVAFFSGLSLLVTGSLLRRHCWRVLGNYFSGHVAAQINHPVITSGAYAWVRHPSYSGALLMNTGVGIAIGSWASAAVLLLASTALYGHRIAVEEKFMLANLGEPYRVFMAGRKRLVPHVY
jgi:protein-S-isoprenylcysteine O-methyltransferase